jgi:Tryptophan-associated transmembrane protein (Trp_oprn_chp)
MGEMERRGASTAGIVSIVGGALLVVGSFLPWAEVSGSGASVTAKGLDGSDGFITLAAGLVAVVIGLVMLRATRRAVAVVAVLAGLVGGGLALYDALTAEDSVLDAAAEDLAPTLGVSADQVRAALDQAVDSGQLGVSVGIGPYMVIIGGVVVTLGGVLGMRESATERSIVSPAASPTPPVTPEEGDAPAPSPPSGPGDA